MVPFDLLQTLCREAGLSLVSASSLFSLPNAKRSLEQWQDEGRYGDMTYLHREPAQMASAHPLLPGARSFFMVSVYYDRRSSSPRPSGFGKVARYAWGKDYHRILGKRLKKVIKQLEHHFPNSRGRSFSDAVPFLERPFAAELGLGFIGKNTLLIEPGEGSFMLLGGAVFTEPIEAGPYARKEGSCGTCFQCAKACPTDAIVGPFVVDARRCISYLTIEKSGMLTPFERMSIGEWVFGCDICQDVCPFNHAPTRREREASLVELSRERGVGPHLSLKDLLAVRTAEQYRSWFQGTPLMRPKREGLLRNAACVAANTGAGDARDALVEAFLHEESAVIRAHAIWALSVLFEKDCGVSRSQLTQWKDRARRDPAECVRNEVGGI
jgi:epoxyqueuosine reductase